MKRIILTMIGAIILFSNVNYASEYRALIKNQYYLEEDGIYVNLANDETDYYNVIEQLEIKNSELNQNPAQREAALQLIKQHKLKLLLTDSLTNDMTKQIMISSVENETIAQSYNLSNFTYSKMDKFYKDYVNTLRKTMDIRESDLIKTESGDVYIYYSTVYEKEQYEMKIYSYATIVNGKLIAINISFTNSDLTKEDANLIVNNIHYDYNAKYSNEYEEKYMDMIFISSIAALIIVIIVKKFVKSKNECELSKQEKEQYKKVGGFLALYIVTVILSISKALIGLIQVSTLGIENKLVMTIMILSNLNIIIMNIIIIVIIIKKEKINKIENLIFKMGIINLILALLISFCCVETKEIYAKEFYKSILYYVLSNTIYPITWGCYFRLSKRVKVLEDKE